MKEQTKNYVGWALVVGIVALAIAALWYAQAYSRSSQPSSYRTFGVSGEGKVVAVPDIARFTFSVVTEGGRDLAALQTENTTKANATIDFLKAQGVDEKDIRTEGYNVEPRYQRSNCVARPGVAVPCPPDTIVGYTVRQTVAVKVRDLAKVGGVLSGVVEAGANTVSQLNFTVDDPAELEAQARGEAIAEAQRKAELIARAGGFNVGRLLSIEDAGDYPRPYYADGMGGAEMALSKVAAPTIEPGSQEIRVTVMLRYEID
jgi:uncharacterized protein YggE